jgi:hypothetical protein
MTTSSDRIQALVQSGTLPSEDAEALLAAVGAPARPSWRRWLLDPMDCFSAVQLTWVGLGVALVGIALERFDVAFDGFLDLHLRREPWSLATSAVRAFVAWPLGALVLWLVSLVAGRQGRLIDFLGLVGVARLPLVGVALPLVLIAATRDFPSAGSTPVPVPTPALVLVTVMALAGVAWLIVLAYRGFVTASGLRGSKRIVAFVAGVLLAEAASQVVLSRLA